MEVHGRHAGDSTPPHDRLRENQDRLQRANRARIRRAREALVDLTLQRGRRIRDAHDTERDLATDRTRRQIDHARRRQDVLELSDAARVETPDADRARDERVEELQRDHAQGTLNTPERIERAAQRLLEG